MRDAPVPAPVPALTKWIASQMEPEASRVQRTREHVTSLKARCEQAIVDQKATGKIVTPSLDTRKWIRATEKQVSLGSQATAAA